MEQVIEDSLRQGVATRTSRITFGWVAVEIAPPTYLVRLAEVSEGEPEGATLYPIRPQFDYTVASLRYAADITTT